MTKKNGKDPAPSTEVSMELTGEILEQLLSGKTPAPDEITGELVNDLKELRASIQATSSRLQAMEKELEGFKHTLSQMHGAHNKTASDLEKWWRKAMLGKLPPGVQASVPVTIGPNVTVLPPDDPSAKPPEIPVGQSAEATPQN